MAIVKMALQRIDPDGILSNLERFGLLTSFAIYH